MKQMMLVLLLSTACTRTVSALQPDAAVLDGATADAPPVDAGQDAGVGPQTQRRISAGLAHVCVLRSGSVTCAGSIFAGPTGLDPTGRPREVPIPGEVVSLASSANQASALNGAGDVYWFGSRTPASGSGEPENMPAPELPIVRGARSLLGDYPLCGLSNVGLHCWFRLPRPNAPLSYSPQLLPLPADTISALVGGDFYLTMDTQGVVRCRGGNRYGQCAVPGTEADIPMTVVQGFRDVAQWDGGGVVGCYVNHAGRVLCWGRNVNGELGDGTLTSRHQPRAVVGVEDAVQVAVGNQVVCATTRVGQVWCWGSRQFAVLGDGRHVVAPEDEGYQQPLPVLVPGLTEVEEVAVGIVLACALRRDQSVWCWGKNDFYALPWRGIRGPHEVIPPP